MIEQAYRFAESSGDVVMHGTDMSDAFHRYLRRTFYVERIKGYSLDTQTGEYTVTALDGDVLTGKMTRE